MGDSGSQPWNRPWANFTFEVVDDDCGREEEEETKQVVFEVIDDDDAPPGDQADLSPTKSPTLPGPKTEDDDHDLDGVLAKRRLLAALHAQRVLPDLLKAHMSGEWTEYHISGLIDREDMRLAPASPELAERLRERVFNGALAEICLRAGDPRRACVFYRKVAMSTVGWAEAYRAWAEALSAAERDDDVLRVYALAVERGVWQHPMQRPNDLYVRGLRAKAFWDESELPSAEILRSSFSVIKREYCSLLEVALGSDKWTAVTDKSLVRSGDWTDFKLIENGKWHPINCARCPETVRMVLELCPDVATQVRGSLIFSRLAGGSVIKPHCGPTNARIRIHLGIDVPEAADDSVRARIRVGEAWRPWVEGECLIFDDSFEHEVVHKGNAPRVVLIADAWHPDLEEATRRRQLTGRHRRRYDAAVKAQASRASAADIYELHPVSDTEVRFLERELPLKVNGLKEAVVVVHSDDAGFQMLLVYIECGGDARLGPNAVCDLCAEYLKAFTLASLVLAVPDWPRGPDGSLDRTRLPPPPPSILSSIRSGEK